MAKFLILNGPNINMLGRRDASIYGSMTLDEINQEISKVADRLGVEVEFFQSNLEGRLVDRVHENWDKVQGIVINPAALTTYGLSLKDALIDIKLPFIEVHLSNPHARESWRHDSVFTGVARGQITGFGYRSYTAALEILTALVEEEST